MKKFSLLIQIAAIAALFCVQTSCSQDTTENIDVVGNQSQLTVELPSTRTYLGDKEGDTYPTYWSDNDAIVVNGAVSTTTTINDNKTSATFYFANVVLETPYYITYPYTEGSVCADGKPTVVFKSEQSYVANTFDVGNAPMCGYFDGSDNIVLQHLAGVMRLSITGNHTISTIEVTAPEGVALAGEFDVDCQSGAISAIEGKTTNKVTYTANETLSADEAKDFFITVPAGNLGVCKVVITEKNGLSMNLQWSATDVKAGIVREFKAFQFKGGASFELGTLPAEEDELVIETPKTQPNNEIWYTSSDGDIVVPYSDEIEITNNFATFGANIVSNTYENGKGVIKFDAPITSIGNSAFYNCTSLTSVTIPDSVTSVSYSAFWYCSSLSSFHSKYASGDNRCIIIDGVLNSFAPYGITSYTVPDNVTTIGKYVFSNCTSLTNITIPDSVIVIEGGAFSACTSLKDVKIGNSVAIIEYEAFCNCTSLTSITIPDSVTEIGIAAFAECYSLTSIYGKYATDDNRCCVINGTLHFFAIGCGVTEYTIPSDVTSIGGFVFYGCSSLTSVTITDGVTTVGDRAFCNCSSLTSVTIPDSVTSIENQAFRSCTSLTNITIPERVIEIGSEAFGDCTSLKEVYCKPITPPTVVEADIWYAFNNNAAEHKIYVPISSLEAYRTADGWSVYADSIFGFITTTLPETGEDGDDNIE